MLFLIGICVSLFPSFKENTDIYSPYDMLYTEINAIFKCDYDVHTGECINLFQIDETDGYEHDLTPVETVTLADDLQLTSIGSNIRILWKQNPTFADRTLIVSDEDYNRIKGMNDCHTGKVNLYQFRDWKTSAPTILKVDAYLH